ncbi:MAG: DUF99 family protein [Myxococcota bacterium]
MGDLSNIVGFDDAPFDHEHRGDVAIIGTVCARTRLDGVLSARVRRDGDDATDAMIRLVQAHANHVQAVVLQGIAVAGFNVVDIHRIHETLERPVLVVARRRPKMEKVLRAAGALPGGAAKRALIEAAGAMEEVAPPESGPRRSAVFVQRAGLTLDAAAGLLRATTLHGNLPEALRLAHLIAGGVTTGASRGRA